MKLWREKNNSIFMTNRALLQHVTDIFGINLGRPSPCSGLIMDDDDDDDDDDYYSTLAEDIRVLT